MKRLHVLTAVSRPRNIPALSAGLYNAVPDELQVAWHWILDLERKHVGGQMLKNTMLDSIGSGWVWVMDDDTVPHPNLFRRWLEVCEGYEAVVFSQQRSDGEILRAAPDDARVGRIDAGQAIVERYTIGSTRIPETYNGDGEFLGEVLKRSNTLFVDEILTYHNNLND